MSRINDNLTNDRLLRSTVNQLALRVNQLERLLDQKEWSEAKVESGSVLHRMVRTSLNNGMSKANWIPTNLADTVTGLPSNANKTKYMVLQLSSDVGAVDDPTKWTIDWVKAHA